MDIATASGSLNATASSKKLPFSSIERELIVALVRDRPVIEDKRTNAKNIELKKRAWEDLTVAYNSQPYVSQRLTHQLKRCWENIKTQRKKELLQESMSLKRTGGGPPDCGSTVSDNVIDTICPFINLRVPGVIDSNTIEILADTIVPDYAKKLEPDNGNPTVTDHMKKPHNAKDSDLENENSVKVINLNILKEKNSISRETGIENEPEENISSQPKRIYNKEIFSTPTNKKKLVSETDARIKRTSINMQQDQELHELRMQREKILIARETNLLEYEKKIQDLQIQKAKLEIELLIKQIGNKTS